MKRLALLALAATVAAVAAAGYWAAERTGFGQRGEVLEVSGPGAVTLLAFPVGFELDPLPAGWHHRRFLTRRANTLSLVEHGGVPALRCDTRRSASMLLRFVSAGLARHSRLEWRWLVEDGIESSLDERTRAGDDHPIRLFLRFADATGAKHAMELIWANVHLQPGEWKYLGDFPHFVVNGGRAAEGRWHDESVDLRDLYRSAWGDPGAARLIEVGVFCDSDETGDSSSALLQYVRLAPAGD